MHAREHLRLLAPASGMAEAEILKACPDLTGAEIREALKYAAEAVRERALPPAAQ